jgi:hypothetical protein
MVCLLCLAKREESDMNDEMRAADGGGSISPYAGQTPMDVSKWGDLARRVHGVERETRHGSSRRE